MNLTFSMITTIFIKSFVCHSIKNRIATNPVRINNEKKYHPPWVHLVKPFLPFFKSLQYEGQIVQKVVNLKSHNSLTAF